MATYDLLKTLTIDGETMGIDASAGKEWFASKNTAVSATASNVWQDTGAEITIDEPGMYLISTNWQFAGASSTGARFVAMGAYMKFNNTSVISHVDGPFQTHSAGNTYIRFSYAFTYSFTEAQVPVVLRAACRSDKASAAEYTNIVARKLIYMGGVIRTLKNSICCRPHFGKAVA